MSFSPMKDGTVGLGGESSLVAGTGKVTSEVLNKGTEMPWGFH